MSAPFTIPELKFDAFIFEIPEPFEAMSNPWTVSPVRVPTLVMFDCAAAVTLWAVLTVPTMAEAGTPVRLAPDPANVPAATVPTTSRLVNVPTEVMFGCDAWETT